MIIKVDTVKEHLEVSEVSEVGDLQGLFEAFPAHYTVDVEIKDVVADDVAFEGYAKEQCEKPDCPMKMTSDEEDVKKFADSGFADEVKKEKE